MPDDGVLTDSTETAWQAGYDTAAAENGHGPGCGAADRAVLVAELAQARAERDAATAQAARLVEENRQADGAAIDLAERLDKATAELKQATAESAGWERLAHARAVGLKEAIAERDRLIATRADAVRLLPALRAQVDAGAAAHPELGPFTDEDVMATVIVAASDVRHLLDREKERAAQLRTALERARDLNNQMASARGVDELNHLGMDLTDVIDGALAATDPAAGQ